MKTYTSKQVLNILNKLRNKLWLISDEYHKPHNELLTACNDGAEALGEFESELIDEIQRIGVSNSAKKGKKTLQNIVQNTKK
jgi:hypothetical protein